MMTEVRWGIIGVGNVCEVKSAPAFNLIEGSKLVAVMRRNGEKARDFAKRHGVPKWYDDADALLNDPEVNAVYIATPPEMHAYYAIRAAMVKKAIYVEKPMARTFSECLVMLRICKSVPLFTAYYRRALPNFLAIKDLLRQGIIGDVRFVNITLHQSVHPDIVAGNRDADNWRTNPEISGGGYFFDLGSHQLDMMDFLFGKINHARGFATNQAHLYEAEDVVSGAFRFENGIHGVGNWCFTTAKNAEKDETTIVGSKGQIRFPFFGDNSVTIDIDGQEPVKLDFTMPKHIQQPLIQTVVDDLLGRGSCPSTGITGARTNKIMKLMMR